MFTNNRILAALPLTFLLACVAPSELPVPTPDVDEALPTEFVDLIGASDGLYPEGIVADSEDRLWVTGFGDGSILRVDADNDVEVWKSAGSDGLLAAVGVQLDEQRDRLWVANFSFETFSSNLKVFDSETGDLLATIEPDPELGPHFFNEVTLADDGRVYVSDTLQPRVWTAEPDLSSVDVFVEDPLLANPAEDRPFGLNGLTLSPEGDVLVASVMDRITPGGGRLVRIDVANRAAEAISLSGDLDVFGGGDGILFDDDGRLLMVNVTPPAAIVSAVFSPDYRTADLFAHTRYDADFDRPTAPAIRGDRLWVVDSQLDHIIDDENGALGTDPLLPFQLTGVDLDALLSE